MYIFEIQLKWNITGQMNQNMHHTYPNDTAKVYMKFEKKRKFSKSISTSSKAPMVNLCCYTHIHKYNAKKRAKLSLGDIYWYSWPKQSKGLREQSRNIRFFFCYSCQTDEEWCCYVKYQWYTIINTYLTTLKLHIKGINWLWWEE